MVLQQLNSMYIELHKLMNMWNEKPVLPIKHFLLCAIIFSKMEGVLHLESSFFYLKNGSFLIYKKTLLYSLELKIV